MSKHCMIWNNTLVWSSSLVIVLGISPIQPPFFPPWGIPPFLLHRWNMNSVKSEGLPMPPKLKCQSCHRLYQSKFTLWRHLKYECGKEPKFTCMFCPKRAYYKTEIWRHMKTRHGQFFVEPPGNIISMKPPGPMPPPQGVNL